MAWKNTEIPFDSVSELAYIIADDVIKNAVQIVTEEQLVELPKEAGITGPTFEIFKRLGNPSVLGTKPCLLQLQNPNMK